MENFVADDMCLLIMGYARLADTVMVLCEYVCVCNGGQRVADVMASAVPCCFFTSILNSAPTA